MNADDPDQKPQSPSAQEGRSGGAPGISLVPEPMQEAEVQAQLDDIDVDTPRVGIVMGSKSDMETMEKAGKELEDRGILHERRARGRRSAVGTLQKEPMKPETGNHRPD